MTKRLFDIIVSLIGILILLPLFILIVLAICIDSRGGVFFSQVRVGKNSIDFDLLKFRSMFTDSDQNGLLTIGSSDKRITKIGYYLRKYKLDELPQLINVFIGDMSLVGPRPEVRKYVELYTPEQKKILSVLPGITDLASIEFINENDLLAKSNTPEETYIKEIMPAKLKLNLQYIQTQSFYGDIKIILKTLAKIIS
jgi:lipopolysaccharide/colanic/teichoic acid biosynthesis glycosyltransferase